LAGKLNSFIQSVFRRFGFQIRRLEQSVSLEDPFSEQLRLVGNNCETIFEVGAADGRDCNQYLELFPQAKLFAFEPVPDSFAKVAESCGNSSRLKAFNVALSNVPGKADFHLSNWSDASSLLKPQATGSTADKYTASNKSIQVAVDTIDSVCERENVSHINLLKMDAQGAELKILEGAMRMLDKGGIDVIYTEILFVEFYKGSGRFDQVMSLLVDKGFRLHNLYHLAHNQHGQLAHCDAIFVKIK
jgi:FkbM family methyltransferase